jgi:hypothetical protein
MNSEKDTKGHRIPLWIIPLMGGILILLGVYEALVDDAAGPAVTAFVFAAICFVGYFVARIKGKEARW